MFVEDRADAEMQMMHARRLCMKPETHLRRLLPVGRKDIADQTIFRLREPWRRIDALD
jgi:hypothetical protein